MIHETGQFTYFISEKDLPLNQGKLLLIALAGPINRPNAPFFRKLLAEVEGKSARWAIITMRDVERFIERPMFPEFAKLQKLIRDKKADLKLCGIHPELRTVLEQAGILRPQEVVNNLQQALSTLTPKG